MSYSLSYSMNKNTHDSDEDGNEVTNDNQFSLSVSVPLDRWMHNTWATYNLNNTKDGTTQNIGLNGTALKEDNLNWNIQKGSAAPAAVTPPASTPITKRPTAK